MLHQPTFSATLRTGECRDLSGLFRRFPGSFPEKAGTVESQENQGFAGVLPTFPAFSDNADMQEVRDRMLSVLSEGRQRWAAERKNGAPKLSFNDERNLLDAHTSVVPDRTLRFPSQCRRRFVDHVSPALFVGAAVR